MLKLPKQFIQHAKKEKWFDEFLIEAYKQKLVPNDESISPVDNYIIWSNSVKGVAYWLSKDKRFESKDKYIVEVFVVKGDTILYNIEEKK